MKPKWMTKMFDIALEKGISLREFSRLGNHLYSAGYLSRIQSGEREVPDSLNFQTWAAQVLGVPREEIFFCLPLTIEIETNTIEKATS